MEHLYPHRFRNGLKLGEWSSAGSNTMKALNSLIENEWVNDEVVYASDYGGLLKYHNPNGSSEDLDGEWLYDNSYDVSDSVIDGTYVLDEIAMTKEEREADEYYWSEG